MSEWVKEGPFMAGNSLAYPNRKIEIMSDADALKNNLRWAAAAVEEAKRAVRLSSNSVWDEFSTSGYALICVAMVRSESDDNNRGKYGLEAMRETAKAARRHGCGNCAEMSAIAFLYLYDQGIKVRLDRMAIQDGDHMFVLLDRAKGSDPTKPETWGARCAIADPWKGVVKPASQIEKLGKEQRYISDWREHD